MLQVIDIPQLKLSTFTGGARSKQPWQPMARAGQPAEAGFGIARLEGGQARGEGSKNLSCAHGLPTAAPMVSEQRGWGQLWSELRATGWEQHAENELETLLAEGTACCCCGLHARTRPGHATPALASPGIGGHIPETTSHFPRAGTCSPEACRTVKYGHGNKNSSAFEYCLAGTPLKCKTDSAARFSISLRELLFNVVLKPQRHMLGKGDKRDGFNLLPECA